MERITYRITLDTHKNGIQRTLQGFETADNISRRIAIGLMASGNTCEFPFDHVEALIYVTTPNATEPSINKCEIEDNTIIYDVLPIVEEGITEMQLKVIETRQEGARSVLISPKFAVEVTDSGVGDKDAEQTTTFTALEDAVAKAKAVYDSRLLRVEIAKDCYFRVYYADGSVYENDYFHHALYNGNALLSESFAHGNTGIREDEDTDNSMYYSNVSKSEALNAINTMGDLQELADEVKKHSIYTTFTVDFESGELRYLSAIYKFELDEESGVLLAEGESYKPDENIEELVNEWLQKQVEELDEAKAEIDVKINNHTANTTNPHGVTPEQIGACKVQHFTFTVGTDWVDNGESFIQTVAVDGILETDFPIVDIVLPSDYATKIAMLDEYAKIIELTTNDGSVTLEFREATEQELTLKMMVVR